MRSIGGGIPATGGTNRLPKLLLFAALLGSVSALSNGRWKLLREWLLASRRLVAIVTAIGIAGLGAAAGSSSGALGRLAAEKLAVAGFAIFHLFSLVPEVSETPFYLNPDLPMYWIGGLVALSLAATVVLLLWTHLLRDSRFWFLAALAVATLLPISALTEGKRYLYLPSAAVSLALGVVVAELRGARFRIAVAAVMVVLAVSGIEVGKKIRDWRWAGALTAEGAAMVDESLKPACGDGHVVFVTSPVGIRGVYNHFYYETFELPRGCMPALFQVLVRVVRIDSADRRPTRERRPRLCLPRRSITVSTLLSSDLWHFDESLEKGATRTLKTALGIVHAQPHGADGVRLTLTLDEAVRSRPPLFFYYSGGTIRRLN